MDERQFAEDAFIRTELKFIVCAPDAEQFRALVARTGWREMAKLGKDLFGD